MSDHEVITYLRYLQHECDLKVTGKPFAITGYAFGVQKKLKKELTVSIFLSITAFFIFELILINFVRTRLTYGF
jgi:hypothetical protein